MTNYIFRFLVALIAASYTLNSLKVQASGLCGSSLINYGQLCCNNEIHNITTESGVEQQCCQGHGFASIYVPKNSLCCAGQLIDRYGSGSRREERKCCYSDKGKESIFTPDNNELCCDGVVNRVDDRKGKDCCGSGYYDTFSQRCCYSRKNSTNVQIVRWKRDENCCGGSIYNTQTFWCKSERVLEIGWDTCNGKEYDVRRQFCCELAYLVDYPADLKGKFSHTITCIQGHVFDSRTHHWEKSLNKTITNDEQVCKEKVYNVHTQECCGNKVFSKMPQKMCCGSSYIDTNSHGCCHSEPYNKAREDCCKGHTKITRSAELECCGVSSINTTNQVCCRTIMQAIPTRKSESNDNKCCNTKAGFQTYNEYTEVCRPEGVVPKPANYTQNPEIPKDLAKTSLFCKHGKREQMKKSCNLQNGFKGIIQDIYGPKRRPILKVKILNTKQWRGKSVTMSIMVKSKCIQKWNRKRILLLTNKTPRVNSSKGYFISITAEDFLMRNSRRNRNLVYHTCFRS